MRLRELRPRERQKRQIPIGEPKTRILARPNTRKIEEKRGLDLVLSEPMGNRPLIRRNDHGGTFDCKEDERKLGIGRGQCLLEIMYSIQRNMHRDVQEMITREILLR